MVCRFGIQCCRFGTSLKDFAHIMRALIWALFVSVSPMLAETDDVRGFELATTKVLLFMRGANTVGGRTASVPQLACAGSWACGTSLEPRTILCTNVGIDHGNGDPIWSCAATLDSRHRLGTTHVVCEGLRSKDDPFVLIGSCALEYTIVSPNMFAEFILLMFLLLLLSICTTPRGRSEPARHSRDVDRTGSVVYVVDGGNDVAIPSVGYGNTSRK